MKTTARDSSFKTSRPRIEISRLEPRVLFSTVLGSFGSSAGKLVHSLSDGTKLTFSLTAGTGTLSQDDAGALSVSTTGTTIASTMSVAVSGKTKTATLASITTDAPLGTLNFSKVNLNAGSLTIAGDAIDQKLFDLIKAQYPKAQLTVNMCKIYKEQYGYVSDTKDKIEVIIPVEGKPTPHDITLIMKQACEIIVPPILDGIKKLVATFNPEFQDRLRNNILLAGGGGIMRGLNKRIEDGLTDIGGARVNVVDEPVYAGANGALQLALDMPGEYWQQLR